MKSLRIIRMFSPGHCGDIFTSDAPVNEPSGVSAEEAFSVHQSTGKRVACRDVEGFADLVRRNNNMNLSVAVWKADLRSYPRWAAISLVLDLAKQFPLTWLDAVGVLAAGGISMSTIKNYYRDVAEKKK